MSDGRIGVWMIGAWGRAGTAVATALAALNAGLADGTGLVSELPKFAKLDFAGWDRFVLGGHEIRKTSSLVEARSLFGQSPLALADLLTRVAPALATFDRNVRTGTLINVGPAIESLATSATLKTRGESPRVAIDRITADLADFRAAHSLDHAVVVNVATTEPPLAQDLPDWSWPELAAVLDRGKQSPIPASTIYALAAMLASCSYINFTPSIGSDLRAAREVAVEKNVLHIGRDGRIAPEQIRFWDFLGQPDGRQLPERVRDGLLAAPLILDLVRFCEFDQRGGRTGVMFHFGSFFNNPMRPAVDAGHTPDAHFDAWAENAARER